MLDVIDAFVGRLAAGAVGHPQEDAGDRLRDEREHQHAAGHIAQAGPAGDRLVQGVLQNVAQADPAGRASARKRSIMASLPGALCRDSNSRIAPRLRRPSSLVSSTFSSSMFARAGAGQDARPRRGGSCWCGRGTETSSGPAVYPTKQPACGQMALKHFDLVAHPPQIDRPDRLIGLAVPGIGQVGDHGNLHRRAVRRQRFDRRDPAERLTAARRLFPAEQRIEEHERPAASGNRPTRLPMTMAAAAARMLRRGGLPAGVWPVREGPGVLVIVETPKRQRRHRAQGRRLQGGGNRRDQAGSLGLPVS